MNSKKFGKAMQTADKVSMVNPISSNNTNVQQTANLPPAATHPAKTQAAPAAQDTVQLSSAAKAALGDAAQGDPDHDGR
jgi:hypothetical protein